ncbi:MAG: ATP-binding protein [Rickettsiales bacterium]|jgi:predicted AAA+ superfamily ATPase|nr:ATP-binding protein [Rickettsiales bacterium]
MIDRPKYIKKLLSVKDQDLVKIVTGVRRCGKSTLFKLYQAELLKMGVMPEQIQDINLEDLDNEHLKEYHRLYNHIKSKLVPNKKNYVFLDEIQEADGFGKVVDSLFLKGADVYVTGSNSKLLSGNIEHTIQRQTFKIEMYPLSFKEYLSGYHWAGHDMDRGNIEYAFSEYMKYGSFPKILEFRDVDRITTLDKERNITAPLRDFKEDEIKTFLSGVYDRVILKDIVENKGIQDIVRLRNIFKFMADNVGKEAISIHKMSKIMSDNGNVINTHTLENYIEAFCNCFMLYRTDRYDIRGKALLKTQQKYYMVDSGMRRLILGGAAEDSGRILENIVYLELLRRGYNVYIGKMGKKAAIDGKDVQLEVDFVAEKNNTKEYYQVSWSVLGNEKTMKREYAPLEEIDDNYPKYLLTMDIGEGGQNGIKRFNILDWLLRE